MSFDVKNKPRSRCALRTSTIKPQTSNLPKTSNSPTRFALTLIELLVVIVILTTLVAGVIPVLSPNNDSRKIREATRMLQTYITMAQAQAARTGRPHGISFRESSPGSGVALDVFQISVPPVYAGFSNRSRVTVAPRLINYGPAGNGGSTFTTQYNGFPLYNLQFLLAAPPPSSPPSPPPYDLFPPRMVRIGDRIDVEGNIFMIVDDNDNQIDSSTDVEYVVSDTTSPTVCIWLNNTGQLLSPAPTALKRYRFLRQPTSAATIAVVPGATAEAPLQLPAGIGIDFQGSVAEGGRTSGSPLFKDSFDDITDLIPPLPANPSYDTVSIMFSPSGEVSSITHNSQPVNNVSRIVLLLGRAENGNLQFSWNGSKVTNGAWVLQNNTQDELEQKQETVNWLNLDSRWLSIIAKSGRVVVSENAFVDARLPSYINTNDDAETAERQIEAAHQFAHEMKSVGAGR